MTRKILTRLQKVWERLHIAIYRHVYIPLIPVSRDVIVFESMLGRGYTDSPRAIYESMRGEGRDLSYRCFWILDKENKKDASKIPGRRGILIKNSFKYYRYMAKAKLWVFNTRQADHVIKRKNQVQIQTWHGTPLKLLGLDMEEVHMAGNGGIESYKANFWRHSRRWDYLVSPSEYTDEIFERCFDFRKNMLHTGYPRNDILVNGNNEDYIGKLKEKYKIPPDRKVILYAPTWRDDESIARGKYIFNPHLNFDKLYRALKDRYVFLVKYHYLIAQKLDFSRFGGSIRSVDGDISELYLISDMHMTDYSSTMFDYAVLHRPQIFYCYDLDTYYKNRGVYMDFEEEAPGPIIKDTDGLIEYLKAPRTGDYEDRYQRFMKKYTHREDGKNSKRIGDLIDKIMKEGEACKSPKGE